MKKAFYILVVAIAFLTASCSKDKSKSLNYNDSNPIIMTFSPQQTKFDHKIQVSSDYDITFRAINDSTPIISVSGDGIIHGKNVGQAKVHISNGYEEKKVDVRVALFREPTFEFGCNSQRIRNIYGSPFESGYQQDTILLYRYIDPITCMYSAACYQMLFFFDVEGPQDIRYIESDVFIRKDWENPLLINYMNDNFDYYYTIHNYFYDNEITHDSVDALIYKYKFDENIRCGRLDHSNKYDDIRLFYYYHEPEDSKNDLDKSLNNLPRSSKFLY